MVATRVLPSPVFISAILPWCSTMPPMTWTSKGRIPRTRTEASRAVAKASGNRSSRGSSAVQALLEAGGFGLELGVGQGPVFRLQVGDVVHQGRHALQLPVVFTAEYLFKKEIYHKGICQ